jgi:uncharacterized Zn-finger protein
MQDHMPTPPETITVDTEKLYCDGSTADAGHPRVFLTMTKNGTVDCPYCGRHFVLNPHAKKVAGGH